MADFPDIKVISIVWDIDADDIEITYDEENMSYYEALGVLRHAWKMQDKGLFRKDIEDIEE